MIFNMQHDIFTRMDTPRRGALPLMEAPMEGFFVVYALTKHLSYMELSLRMWVSWTC